MAYIDEQNWYGLVKSNAVLKTYSPRETIHFQGRTSQTIGLIISGHVETVTYTEDGDEIWLEEFSAGDFVGHISFLKDVPSQDELIARTDVSLLLIPTLKMQELLQADELLLTDFMQNFTKRLNVVKDRLTGAYVMSMKERICAELMRLSQEIGIEPDKYIIRPNPVMVDMARRLNSTRETVSRTVSDLQKLGVISRVPGALIIENAYKLKTAYK